MAIDIEKLQEYTGIKADTTEDFIAQFPKRFIPADQKHWDDETKNSVFGRTLGSVKIGIKQHFDELGVVLTGEDLNNTPEAVTKLGLQRLSEKFGVEKSELEKTAGLSADEKIKEAQETIGKLTAKNKDFEKLLKTKADEFEQLNQTKAQELKNFKLSSKVKDVESAINWNPEKDEYSRKGFLADMRERTKIDLDENDDEFIVNRATGERIKAEGSHSTFMSPKDYYIQESVRAGMGAVNKKAGLPPAAKRESGQPAQPPAKPATPVSFGAKKVLANTRYIRE